MSEQRAVFRLQRLGLRGARFETSPFSDPSLRPCSSSHDIPVKQDDGSPQTVEGETPVKLHSPDLNV